MLAVVLQLIDRLADIRQRRVIRLLDEAFGELGAPAPAQFLERTHVDIAVVKPGFELRHVAHHEAPVLTDRVTAHGTGTFRNVFTHKCQGGRFHGSLVQRRRPDPSDQPRPAVGLLVPVVHRIELRVGLVDDPDRRLGNGLQIAVGDNHRHFDDALAFRFQAGHFHVQPNKVIRVLCHIICPSFRNPDFLTAR